MAKTTSAGAGDAGAPFSLPADLSALGLDELTALRERASAEFNAIYEKDGGPTSADLEPARKLADAIEAIGTREGEIATEQAETAAEFEALRTRATPPQATEPDGDVVDAPADDVEPDTADGVPNPALVTASGQRPTGGATSAPRDLGGLSGPKRNLNPSLAGARKGGPAQQMQTPELAITASVGSPGKFEAGATLPNQRALAELMESRASRLADAGGRYASRRAGDPYGGQEVAKIANQYEAVFSDETPGDVLDAWLSKIDASRRPQAFEALVAAGGWCAPSETRYDFFNVACEGGMVDLPTFGVSRGGIRFPVSPSVADVFTSPSALAPFTTTMTNATVPWLWTETDDIATVTGTPNKPCMRIPCSTMTDVRLECYGICLTAGNLANDAWPESTRNFLRLLMSAHFHASNARYISQMLTLATVNVTGGGAAAGSGMVAPVLGLAELNAWDYRTKYGMCDDDVLEYVLPSWAVGAARSDLAKRMGVSDLFCVSEAQLAQWFSCRNIRVQFVQDYQVRTATTPGGGGIAGLNAWPTTVQGMMYAAGTVARGNGMSLDLGVVRDSTLNAENDFTAAWMEECHLIARFGHEIRTITTNICTDGTTGAADLTACAP